MYRNERFCPLLEKWRSGAWWNYFSVFDCFRTVTRVPCKFDNVQTLFKGHLKMESPQDLFFVWFTYKFLSKRSKTPFLPRDPASPCVWRAEPSDESVDFDLDQNRLTVAEFINSWCLNSNRLPGWTKHDHSFGSCSMKNLWACGYRLISHSPLIQTYLGNFAKPNRLSVLWYRTAARISFLVFAEVYW